MALAFSSRHFVFFPLKFNSQAKINSDRACESHVNSVLCVRLCGLVPLVRPNSLVISDVL